MIKTTIHAFLDDDDVLEIGPIKMPHLLSIGYKLRVEHGTGMDYLTVDDAAYSPQTNTAEIWVSLKGYDSLALKSCMVELRDDCVGLA